MPVYGEMPLHFSEQFQKIACFDMQPKINAGWIKGKVAYNYLILQNSTPNEVIDSNGNLAFSANFFVMARLKNWIAYEDVWERLADDAFKITDTIDIQDVSSKYPVGQLLQWKQNSYRKANVIEVEYTEPDDTDPDNVIPGFTTVYILGFAETDIIEDGIEIIEQSYMTMDGLRDGTFIEHDNDVFRLQKSKDWKFLAGFFRYDAVKLVGDDGKITNDIQPNTGSGSFL